MRKRLLKRAGRAAYIFRFGEGNTSRLVQRAEVLRQGFDICELWICFGGLLVGIFVGPYDNACHVTHTLGFIPFPLGNGGRVQKLEVWEAIDDEYPAIVERSVLCSFPSAGKS